MPYVTISENYFLNRFTKFEIHIVAQFDNHNSQVWRVSWNITGTVLASSGDDGCVRLWKGKTLVEDYCLILLL